MLWFPLRSFTPFCRFIVLVALFTAPRILSCYCVYVARILCGQSTHPEVMQRALETLEAVFEDAVAGEDQAFDCQVRVSSLCSVLLPSPILSAGIQVT